MLNVGKLVAAPRVGRYYVEQVAGGREDYYAGEGEAAGYWTGSAAAGLELTGEVSEGALTQLLAAQDPRTGLELRRPLQERAVAGYDLTFRAPKSVSIVF